MCGSLCNVVNGTGGGKDWFVGGVVQGELELSEGVFGKVGFLCKEEVMVEGKQLVQVCVDGTNVGCRNSDVSGNRGGGLKEG